MHKYVTHAATGTLNRTHAATVKPNSTHAGTGTPNRKSTRQVPEHGAAQPPESFQRSLEQYLERDESSSPRRNDPEREQPRVDIKSVPVAPLQDLIGDFGDLKVEKVCAPPPTRIWCMRPGVFEGTHVFMPIARIMCTSAGPELFQYDMVARESACEHWLTCREDTPRYGCRNTCALHLQHNVALEINNGLI